jgi:ribonucleoside-diphosphate reductase alpha chain
MVKCNGFYLSENSLKVLETRYLRKGQDGKPIEEPQDMFQRVARNVASAEKLFEDGDDPELVEEEFYKLMTSLEFMPNSPTLMNAGRELQQLSACFVLPVEDSINSIFEMVKATALIHKSGGGTGFSFSRIRPRNALVTTSHGRASGPISFMKVFNEATEAINQGGFRRGANMGILRVDHPDILEFIDLKLDLTQMTNFNISVALTEDFVKAAQKGDSYDLKDPRTKAAVGTLNAREVFDKIVHNAWANGEPGIIFLDRINRDNPTPHKGEIESTNPCGEQPLLPFEACNLGSINLAKVVENGKINYGELRRIVDTSVRFLDNVVEVNNFPLPEINEMVRANRKIGLGVMGFADMLIELGVPYNSKEAVALAEKVMKFIDDASKDASAELARRRGEFPNFKGSIFDKKGGRKIRNATTSTIAPTGTISIISACSSGVEPIFALVYKRNVLDGKTLYETNPMFEKIARERGFFSEELMEKVAKTGSVSHIDEVPEDVKKIFVTAHDVSPEWHIRIQAAFQKYCDNAVSKTVNFSNAATEEDIREAYMLAYELDCKGVTVYRDGSRQHQVLSTESTGKEKKEPAKAEAPAAPRKKMPRPARLRGVTYKYTTGCGPIYITVNEDDTGRPFELFAEIGKAGGCAGSQCQGIGRMISLAWRSGLSAKDIVKQLIGISCHSPSGFGNNKILSCSDAIAKAVRTYLGEKESLFKDVPPVEKGKVIDMKEFAAERNSMGACPDCGGPIEHEGGCSVCRLCGYSKCA